MLAVVMIIQTVTLLSLLLQVWLQPRKM
jgi:hypothetical protein